MTAKNRTIKLLDGEKLGNYYKEKTFLKMETWKYF